MPSLEELRKMLRAKKAPAGKKKITESAPVDAPKSWGLADEYEMFPDFNITDDIVDEAKPRVAFDTEKQLYVFTFALPWSTVYISAMEVASLDAEALSFSLLASRRKTHPGSPAKDAVAMASSAKAHSNRRRDALS